MRLKEKFIEKLKGYIQVNEVPPDSIQTDLQITALTEEGFGWWAVNAYRDFVKNMSVEQRKDIFFLRVNDEMFIPYVKPVGHSIVT